MADQAEQVWNTCEPASFEVPGLPRCIFPVWGRLEADQSVRVAARSIPWVDGEELDETGLGARTWTCEAAFINDISKFENGIGDNPPLYPDRLELLERIFQSKKTGTLHLLWKRNIRAKLVQFRRIGDDSRRDCEVVALTFKEDNEAKLDAQTATGVAVQVNTRLQVAKATFDAERSGMWDGSWENITLLASQLEAALNAPGDFLEDIGQKAHRVQAAIDRIFAAFQTNTEGRDGMRDPEGAAAWRQLFLLRMLAEDAEAQARAGRPTVIVVRVPRDTSIWAFSAQNDQDPDLLLRLNPQVEDPNWIPAGTQLNLVRA